MLRGLLHRSAVACTAKVDWWPWEHDCPKAPLLPCSWHLTKYCILGTLCLQALVQKQVALGVWKVPVSLDGYSDYPKLVYTQVTFRSTAPMQIYFLVHVLRNRECLVGSWASSLSSCGDLPPTWAVLGRGKRKIHPGLHCRGSTDHLPHKPRWQHC